MGCTGPSGLALPRSRAGAVPGHGQGRGNGICVCVRSKGVHGVVRKARGCSVLRRSGMGSDTLCRDECFGGWPCALHAEQGASAWEALGCSVEGVGGEGGEGRVPDWARNALWGWGQCSRQVDRGVLPEGARELGREGWCSPWHRVSGLAEQCRGVGGTSVVHKHKGDAGGPGVLGRGNASQPLPCHVHAARWDGDVHLPVR